MWLDVHALAAIAGMAAATYLVRLMGVWMVGVREWSPFLAASLRHAPGGILVAMLAPTIVAGGFPALAAAAVTLVVSHRTGNLPVAMFAGVAAVILCGAFV